MNWLRLLGCLAFVKYFYLCPTCQIATIYLLEKPISGTPIYAHDFCFLDDTQPVNGTTAICPKCRKQLDFRLSNFKELPI